VLLELCRMFPDAPLYTLLWKRGSVDPEIEQHVAGTSFLQWLPGASQGYRNYLPLFPAAVRSLGLPAADLVLSSSHAVAKGVRAPDGAVHASYIHTPMRYVWPFGADYFGAAGAAPIKRAALAAAGPYLRWFDRASAAGVERFAANSENVARRIRQVWGRDAEVIYPPIDTAFFEPGGGEQPEDFYLLVSSLEPYKRVDLAIEACRRLGRRLLIAGDGTSGKRLRRRAGGGVELLGRVDDVRLRNLYQRCRALIFPGLEDFGMTPLEAQACGRPVVYFAAGGALESVTEATGVGFAEQRAERLIEAIERLESRNWKRPTIREHSLRFSTAVFRDKMERFVGNCLAAVPGAQA
jgi:glycosyltransferase involved in cell wall biosynthesis